MDFDFEFDTINPTITGTLTVGGTAAIDIPAGTTAQQPPSPSSGMARFNTTTGLFEFYNGTSWINFSSTDNYVRVSATDTTSSYLQSKILAGTGISLVASGAGNQTLTITNTASVTANQSCIQIRTTNSFTTSATLTAVSFNTSDVLNNSTVLNWTSGTIITVGSTGPYHISYMLPDVGSGGTRTITATVYRNTTTAVPGSTTVSINPTGNSPAITGSCVANLTSGDTIQLYVSDTRSGDTMPAGVVFTIIGLSAATGPQGPQGTAGATGASGSGSTLNIASSGTILTGSPFGELNFTGAGVVVTAGTGVANISIPGGTGILQTFIYYPANFDNPINASWAINSLAPMVSDPSYSAFNVRSFLDTTSQGVGCYCTIPAGAVNVTINFKGRAQTAPSSASVVAPALYIKAIPNASTVGAWSSPYSLATLAVPTDANFHYYTQTVTIASLGMSAGTLYQLELVRLTTGFAGTNLTGAWLMTEFTLQFS